MQAVIGRKLKGSVATLHGFHRSLIEGCVFPGIVRQSGSNVTGILFRDVDDETMQRLDRYEAPFYERIEIDLVTPNHERVQAEVYALPESEAWRLCDTPWDEAHFRNEHLASYLRW